MAVILRLLSIAGALLTLALPAIGQTTLTWEESGLRDGEPWREITTVEIGDDGIRAVVRRDGDPEPFMGVEFRVNDTSLRVVMSESGAPPIETSPADLEDLESQARRAAPELYVHPLRRGKLFRLSSSAEILGVACTNYLYQVDGQLEPNMEAEHDNA